MQDRQKVIVNDKSFLTVEHFTWHYAGGAHENRPIYDLKTGAEVDLKSLVKPGYENSVQWSCEFSSG
jgi:hypothetical protein